MTQARAEEIRWEAPGPGPWEVERIHYTRPFPRFGRERFREGYIAGFAEGAARYGLLLSRFEVGIVNDFWYQRPAAFLAPEGAKGPPPAPILWLLTRLHPAMRARIRTCARAFDGRLWREDLATWDATDKPRATARHLELLAVAPGALDDDALLLHLGACEDHLGHMMRLHHQYTLASLIPAGELLCETAEWTGRAPGEILRLLRGSTEVSLGFSTVELAGLAGAIGRDAGAKSLLDGSDGAAVLQALRARAGEVGAAATALCDLVWHRAVSFTVGDKAIGEMPEILVGALRAAVAGRHRARPEDAKARVKALRDRVPSERRSRFDELLEEARVMNRLRDERGLYADCWALGIARRGALELGRRLAQSRALHQADHAVDLTLDEARALVGGGRGPSADDVAKRAHWRTTRSIADAPRFLGGEPGGPPDVGLLPAAARRATRAVEAIITNLYAEADATSTRAVIRGLSVNEGEYEGTARVIETSRSSIACSRATCS